jgi:hypothetical protein
MGEKSFRVGKHLFVAERTIDRNQHWHGESYPWASGINLRIERWIGEISSNTK